MRRPRKVPRCCVKAARFTSVRRRDHQLGSEPPGDSFGPVAAVPNYRILGGIPLAYAIIVSGALIRNKRLRLRTDLSYGVYIYAFPIQQFLLICGLVSLDPIVFSILAAIATLPLAALSWFLVEKPALSLRSRLKQRSVVRSGAWFNGFN